MRSKKVLIDDLSNILILQQYLYMSEDHCVSVHNSIGVILEIRMDENLDYYCKNTHLPHLPDMYYSGEMSNSIILGIIEQLKHQSAKCFRGTFSNRWDEIKSICKSNLVLNL